MGLDMYAYAKDSKGEEEPLADWRKHNRLHGWMEELWEENGKPFDGNLDEFDGTFNCVSLELTIEDIDVLEAHVIDMTMPETGGFFFGGDSFDWDDDDGNKLKEGDYYYKETDLQFVYDARKAIEQGKKVYYNSWW